MSIWPLIGLPIGFAVISGLVLWTVFKRCHGAVIGISACALIWYGLVLYHVPDGFEGWPRDDLPEQGVLISYKVIEPEVDPEESGIFLWIVPKPLNSEDTGFDPLAMLQHSYRNVPRAFKIPYDRDTHEALEESAAQADKSGGILAFKEGGWGEKGKSKEGENYEDDSQWRVIDPQDLMPKEDDEGMDRLPPTPARPRQKQWSA